MHGHGGKLSYMRMMQFSSKIGDGNPVHPIGLSKNFKGRGGGGGLLSFKTIPTSSSAHGKLLAL